MLPTDIALQRKRTDPDSTGLMMLSVRSSSRYSLKVAEVEQDSSQVGSSVFATALPKSSRSVTRLGKCSNSGRSVGTEYC
eukprot:572658-Rhodomonas_salina.1